MSNSQLTIQDRIFSLEKEFSEVNSYKMNFVKEAQFSLQLLQGNDYLLKAAQANPSSLEYAIINLASIGISLNPALKESYLVPRGGKICLDISYMGLVKLATDTGSIVWVQAEIVKEKDTFEYMGLGQKPLHKFQPFGDRGPMIGAYCVAKLATGEFLTTVMSKAEIEEIKNKSSQAAKSGPWVSFYEEMAKKTTIKRASKLWPKSERVQKAADVLNEYEGIDFNSFNKGAHIDSASSDIVADDKTFKNIRDLLVFNKKTEEGLVKYINTKFKTEISSIDEFTPEMIEETYRAMGSK